MFLTALCVAVFTLYIVYAVIAKRRRSLDLPKIPGPKGWPILGILPQIRGRPTNEILRQWAERYGGIFKIGVLGQDMVVLSSYESLHEALVEKGSDFGGRPRRWSPKPSKSINIGIIGSDVCPKWRYLRKEVHTSLKHYGKGLSKFEDVLEQLLNDLINVIEEEDGKTFDMYQAIYLTISVFMASLITGRRLERNDPLVELTIGSDKFPRKIGATMFSSLLLQRWPWVRHFGNKTHRLIMERERQENYFWENFIIPLQKTQEYLDGKGLTADMFRLKENPKFDFVLSKDDILNVVGSIIMAGIVTTTSSLYALFNILLHHPHVQERIEQELPSLTERVCLSDKARMPYTRAVILELLRFSSVVPLSLPHVTMVDTKVAGYRIPKGTRVVMNLWALHHSEEYWDEPWSFKPERFLDKDGLLLLSGHPVRKKLMPFGAGTRGCVGENLALNRIFLFVTTLVQRFRLLPEDGTPLVTCDPREYDFGQVLEPKHYRLRAVRRQQCETDQDQSH